MSCGRFMVGSLWLVLLFLADGFQPGACRRRHFFHAQSAPHSTRTPPQKGRHPGQPGATAGNHAPTSTMYAPLVTASTRAGCMAHQCADQRFASVPPRSSALQRQGRVQEVDDDKRGEPGVRGHFSGTSTNFKPSGNGGVRSWSLTSMA